MAAESNVLVCEYFAARKTQFHYERFHLMSLAEREDHTAHRGLTRSQALWQYRRYLRAAGDAARLLAPLVSGLSELAEAIDLAVSEGEYGYEHCTYNASAGWKEINSATPVEFWCAQSPNSPHHPLIEQAWRGVLTLISQAKAASVSVAPTAATVKQARNAARRGTGWSTSDWRSVHLVDCFEVITGMATGFSQHLEASTLTPNSSAPQRRSGSRRHHTRGGPEADDESDRAGDGPVCLNCKTWLPFSRTKPPKWCSEKCRKELKRAQAKYATEAAERADAERRLQQASKARKREDGITWLRPREEWGQPLGISEWANAPYGDCQHVMPVDTGDGEIECLTCGRTLGEVRGRHPDRVVLAVRSEDRRRGASPRHLLPAPWRIAQPKRYPVRLLQVNPNGITDTRVVEVAA